MNTSKIHKVLLNIRHILYNMALAESNSAPINVSKFLSMINSIRTVDKDAVDYFNNFFGVRLPIDAQKIITLCSSDNQIFIKVPSGNLRLLQIEEVNDMVIELGNNLIPFIDATDNDYICFNTANNTFCMYNVTDKVTFNNNKKDLRSLLK